MMFEQTVLKYSEALKELGIEHEFLGHPSMVDPVEVQTYLGVTMDDCVATLVMKADERFVAFLKTGVDHLDFKKIKKGLKVKNLRFATREEFDEKTHLPFGAARVYMMGLETYIDEKVFEREYLNGGTGSFECTFRYKTDDLKKIPGSVVMDITD